MARTKSIPGLLVAVLCGTAALPASGGTVLRRSVDARIRVITLPSDSARFDLPGEWIRPASVHVVLEADTLRPGVDYDLETTEGILRLLRPLPPGHLTVRYQVLPLAIGRIFQEPIPPDTGSVVRVPIPPRATEESAASSRAHLDIRGSKTVSLEIGSSEDLTVRQSLDVSLSGEIVEGVRVRGVLSDRQTPLQAEGRTTELSDLDRVFLEVEGPRAGMVLGDFVLRGPGGLFTRYERQLEGIRVTGRTERGNASVAAATIPGVYQSIDFTGVEGKQGPYSLRPAGASLDAAVVAGTERVWLDGELLVRGEDRDYLIDYAASTLTFTGRRVVNQASRITVDCQISTQPYRRSAYAAEVGWGAAVKEDGRGFGLRTSILSERDDKGRPVGGPLTEREKQLLAAAGDSLVEGGSGGVDCGPTGHGNYEQVEADSLTQPFYRYVGDSLGTCTVRFDDLGDGKGDYRDSTIAGGKTIFRFVGPHRGRFVPGRAVPRPSERSTADLLGFWSGRGVTLEVEGAGSYDDPNTYSSLDDGDRTGGALRLHLARGIAPVRAAGRSLGRWGLDVETRDVERRFRSMGRIDPGWIGYEWGITSDRLAGGDRRRTVRAQHEPGGGFSLEGLYESISNRRDLDGNRTMFRLQRTGRIFGNAELQRVSTEDRKTGIAIPGRRRVGAAVLGFRWLRAESNIGFRREDSRAGGGEGRVGSGFDEWRGSTAWTLGGDRGRFELARTLRQDRAVQAGSRSDQGRARTWDVRAVYQPTGRILDLRYTRRDLSQAGVATRSDLAGLLWSQEQPSGRFGQQLRADLTSQEQDVRTKSIERVAAGTGHYDSLGVYVGKGDYDVVLRPTGARRLERRLDGSWRIEFAPGRGRDVSPRGLRRPRSGLPSGFSTSRRRPARRGRPMSSGGTCPRSSRRARRGCPLRRTGSGWRRAPFRRPGGRVPSSVSNAAEPLQRSDECPVGSKSRSRAAHAALHPGARLDDRAGGAEGPRRRADAVHRGDCRRIRRMAVEPPATRRLVPSGGRVDDAPGSDRAMADPGRDRGNVPDRPGHSRGSVGRAQADADRRAGHTIVGERACGDAAGARTGGMGSSGKPRREDPRLRRRDRHLGSEGSARRGAESRRRGPK